MCKIQKIKDKFESGEFTKDDVAFLIRRITSLDTEVADLEFLVNTLENEIYYLESELED